VDLTNLEKLKQTAAFSYKTKPRQNFEEKKGPQLEPDLIAKLYY